MASSCRNACLAVELFDGKLYFLAMTRQGDQLINNVARDGCHFLQDGCKEGRAMLSQKHTLSWFIPRCRNGS